VCVRERERERETERDRETNERVCSGHAGRGTMPGRWKLWGSWAWATPMITHPWSPSSSRGWACLTSSLAGACDLRPETLPMSITHPWAGPGLASEIAPKVLPLAAICDGAQQLLSLGGASDQSQTLRLSITHPWSPSFSTGLAMPDTLAGWQRDCALRRKPYCWQL
jgi:hypothetical protein